MQSIESGNILVEMNGICKISDFSLATKTGGIEEGARNVALLGTIYWMAPETINTNSGYNIKSDIWSLGCVVLEMWGGMRPWIGDEMVNVMFKVRCIVLTGTYLSEAESSAVTPKRVAPSSSNNEAVGPRNGLQTAVLYYVSVAIRSLVMS